MDHNEYIKIITEECRMPSRTEFIDFCKMSGDDHIFIIATLSGIALGVYSIIDLLKEVVKK